MFQRRDRYKGMFNVGGRTFYDNIIMFDDEENHHVYIMSTRLSPDQWLDLIGDNEEEWKEDEDEWFTAVGETIVSV